MQDLTPSRRDRRARASNAARIYGLDGDAALDVHEAYAALGRNDVGRAVELAFPLSQRHPGNPHPWIVLGGAALARREGTTAAAFFGEAAKVAPGDATVLVGLAKAHVLKAEVEEAVATAERAFAAGATEPGLVSIYLDFMSRLGRRLRAADHLAPVLRKIGDADLCLRMGDMLADADETGKAVEWLERGWTLNPGPEKHQLARLRALVWAVRLDEAEAYARDLMGSVKDVDQVVLALLTILRVTGRAAEALALADTHHFAGAEAYAHSRAIVANLVQDLDRADEAEAAYLEGLHINGGSDKAAKALGVFRFRARDFAGGAELFAQRMPEIQRRRIPLANADPENLASLRRVHLMGEQGIGDQFALLPLVRLAPIDTAAEVVLVGDARLGPALEGNDLGLRHVPVDDFISNPQQIAPRELVYLGDLTRHLTPPATRLGGYLHPDARKVDALRARYQALAGDRPLFGLAWRSNSLIGKLRSVSLVDLVQALPEGAFAVSLQYGDIARDLAQAAAVRPDVRIFADPSVDQMTDLAGFLAQVQALDTVVSIDNTTVHAAGALGHGDTHVLVPRGSECMWYWGTEGQIDPWYGNLNLHRQNMPGDWAPVLSGLAARFGAPSYSS